MPAKRKTLNARNLTKVPYLNAFSPTKLQTYMQCERQFFYRHIFGWTKDRDNIDLVFGSAWHKAMEVLLKTGDMTGAIGAFRKEWKAELDEELQDGSKNKNLQRGFIMLGHYETFYAEDNFELLDTEIRFEHNLAEKYYINGHIDALVVDKNTGELLALEHKTTGKWLSGAYLNQFKQSMQVLTYYFAAREVLEHMGYDRIDAIVLNMACTSARNVDKMFLRIKLRFDSVDYLDWLNSIIGVMESIKNDVRKLHSELKVPKRDRPKIMSAFQKRTVWCDRCPYVGVCTTNHNPTLDQVRPLDYLEVYWDPIAGKDRPA